LGEELKLLGDKLLGSRLKSKIAILFDWENWWAVEFSSGPNISLRYVQQIEKYYKAFYDINISIDMVKPEADLSGYNIVVAPVLYMVKPGVAKNIEDYVEKGGTFVTTFFSGIVDENDLVTLGGYPGELRKVLGIWVEEIDALLPDMKNSIVVKKQIGNLKEQYDCGLLCELIHLETAKEIAVYGRDFYAGMPSLTVNEYGKGKAYYITTDPDIEFIKGFVGFLCDERGITAAIKVPDGVEITERYKDSAKFTFILNHNSSPANIDLGEQKYINMFTNLNVEGDIILESKGVVILESKI
jgi:beta-galactosidase